MTKITCPKCGQEIWGKTKEDAERILEMHYKYDICDGGKDECV